MVKQILKTHLIHLHSNLSGNVCAQFLNTALTRSSGFHQSGIILEPDGKIQSKVNARFGTEDGEWLMQELPHFLKRRDLRRLVSNQRCGIDISEEISIIL